MRRLEPFSPRAKRSISARSSGVSAHSTALHVLLELLGLRRAGDDARHVGLGGEPAEGELEQAAAVALGEVLQPLDFPPVGLGHVAVGEALRGGEPRALRRRRVALVLAGQKPARQREERQQPHPVRLDRRHELALDVAHDEAVLVLARDEGVEVPRVGRPLRLDHLPGGEVRAADVADLALADEVVEGAQRLLDRRQRVGAVELVEVDPVGAGGAAGCPRPPS